MFEKLSEIGEAFKNYGKDKETKIVDMSNTTIEDDRSTEDSITEASDIIETQKNEEANKDSDEKVDLEVNTTKKDEEKKGEDTLEKKLKNIEKVIDTFSGSGGEQLSVPKNPLDIKASDNINVKPVDMGSVQAKELITEYLKPSVNSDRVGLLYENLRKLNLI
jgi:hypothetical protein|tara:strand:- start:75 stop:563 length:489 start_codon:yes stop_codon:yes gene_type:complete